MENGKVKGKAEENGKEEHVQKLLHGKERRMQMLVEGEERD